MTRTKKIESVDVGMCRANAQTAAKSGLGALGEAGGQPKMSMKPVDAAIDIAEQFRANPFAEIVRQPLGEFRSSPVAVPVEQPAQLPAKEPAKISPVKTTPPKEIQTPASPKKVAPQVVAEVADDTATKAVAKADLADLARGARTTALVGGVLLHAMQDTPAKNNNEVLELMDPHAGDRMADETDYFVRKALNMVGFDVEVPTPPWRRAE